MCAYRHSDFQFYMCAHRRKTYRHIAKNCIRGTKGCTRGTSPRNNIAASPPLPPQRSSATVPPRPLPLPPSSQRLPLPLPLSPPSPPLPLLLPLYPPLPLSSVAARCLSVVTRCLCRRLVATSIAARRLCRRYRPCRCLIVVSLHLQVGICRSCHRQRQRRTASGGS